MQTGQITFCACALLWAVSAVAAERPEVEAPEMRLDHLHQLLALSGRSSTKFTVKKRWGDAREGRSILEIELSDGGSASIDEKTGTVFSFSAPHFEPPQNLEPEQILDAEDAFAKLAPVLKAYPVKQSSQDYSMGYMNGLWIIDSKPSVDYPGVPARMCAMLTVE